jgi:hypothetical protein
LRLLARGARTTGIVVGPSVPQFQLLLLSLPSRPCFAVGFVVFEVVTHEIGSVKPSWAVTKLTDERTWRPPWLKSSLEPVKREASSGTTPS